MVIPQEAGRTFSWLLVRCICCCIEVNLPDFMLPVEWTMEITQSRLLFMGVKMPLEAFALSCSISAQTPIGRETVKSLESSCGLLPLSKTFPQLSNLGGNWQHECIGMRPRGVMIPCLDFSVRVKCLLAVKFYLLYVF